MMDKIVFCEGIYDFKIINKIIDIEKITGVTIMPTGGKTTLKCFVQAIASTNRVIQADFIIVRDRDCDFSDTIQNELAGNFTNVIAGTVSTQQIDVWQEQKETIKLIPISYQEFVLKRICIENYFLDFDAIVKFNDGKNEKLDTYEKCKAIFDQAAKDLIHYAAIRHALGLCKQNQWNAIRLETSLSKSKQLPKNLDTKTLLQEICDNISTYKDAVDKDATYNYFENKYNHFLNLFEQPTSIQDSRYLEFFSASDLQNQVGNILKKSKTGFSFEKYYDSQIQNFDYTNFPDWVEFVDLLKS